MPVSGQIRAKMFFAHVQSFFGRLEILFVQSRNTRKTYRTAKERNHYLARSVWLISLKHNNNGREGSEVENK